MPTSMPTSPPAMPPPGWYADPEQPWTWRWWDGSRWTDLRAPMVRDEPVPNPHSVSRWFDDSVAAVKAVARRVGLLVLAVGVVVSVTAVIFVIGVLTSGRGREIRSLLQLDDVFGGSAETVELTDAEWDRVGDLARDVLVSAIPWMIALGVLGAIALTWTAAISARVATRVHPGTVAEVSRVDDAADALRRVPAMIAAFCVLSLIGVGTGSLAFAPLMLAVGFDAGGGAVAVAAVFGFLAVTVLGVWLFGRLGLTMTVAAIGGHGLGLRRSWHLTDGRFWGVVGRLLIASLVVSSATTPLSFLVNLGPWFGLTVWLVTALVFQTLTNVLTALVVMPSQVVLVRHLDEQQP